VVELLLGQHEHNGKLVTDENGLPVHPCQIDCVGRSVREIQAALHARTTIRSGERNENPLTGVLFCYVCDAPDVLASGCPGGITTTTRCSNRGNRQGVPQGTRGGVYLALGVRSGARFGACRGATTTRDAVRRNAESVCMSAAQTTPEELARTVQRYRPHAARRILAIRRRRRRLLRSGWRGTPSAAASWNRCRPRRLASIARPWRDLRASVANAMNTSERRTLLLDSASSVTVAGGLGNTNYFHIRIPDDIRDGSSTSRFGWRSVLRRDRASTVQWVFNRWPVYRRLRRDNGWQCQVRRLARRAWPRQATCPTRTWARRVDDRLCNGLVVSYPRGQQWCGTRSPTSGMTSAVSSSSQRKKVNRRLHGWVVWVVCPQTASNPPWTTYEYASGIRSRGYDPRRPSRASGD